MRPLSDRILDWVMVPVMIGYMLVFLAAGIVAMACAINLALGNIP